MEKLVQDDISSRSQLKWCRHTVINNTVQYVVSHATVIEMLNKH